MAISLQLGEAAEEIGSGSFFHCFFSTVSGNLEPAGWGSRFPALLVRLYQGELQQERAGQALHELAQVAYELAALPPNRVI